MSRVSAPGTVDPVVASKAAVWATNPWKEDMGDIQNVIVTNNNPAKVI